MSAFKCRALSALGCALAVLSAGRSLCAQANGEPDPFSDTRTPAEREAAREPAATEARHVALDAELQFRVFNRALGFDDDRAGVMRPYELDAAPAFKLAVETHPAAFFSRGVAHMVGLVAGYGRAFALQSTDSRGVAYDTTAWEATVGLRLRAPLDPSDPDLALVAAWHRQVFYVRAEEGRALRGVADLVYDSARLGVSARVPVGERFSVRADAAYLFVVSTGELGEAFFPHATSGAVDASAAVAARVTAGVEARLGVEVRYYFHTMNAEPGDAYQVAGASDRYLFGTLGVAWRR